MPEDLESFVKKLQDEGADAGKRAALEIEKEAKQEAEKLLADAKKEAEKIVKAAKDDADKRYFRVRSELDLTVRDTILKLEETLGQILGALLMKKIEKRLSDTDYIGGIIREVVVSYARADAVRQIPIEIHIPKKMRDEFTDHILSELAENLEKAPDNIAIKATLSKAGFEYKIRGATVEVDPESLADFLYEMVSPALQEIIRKAVGGRSQEALEEAKTQKHREMHREE